MNWDWGMIAAICGIAAAIMQFYKSNFDVRIKSLNVITMIAMLSAIYFSVRGVWNFYVSTEPISRLEILTLLQNAVIGTLMILWLGAKLWHLFIAKAYPSSSK